LDDTIKLKKETTIKIVTDIADKQLEYT